MVKVRYPSVRTVYCQVCFILPPLYILPDLTGYECQKIKLSDRCNQQFINFSATGTTSFREMFVNISGSKVNFSKRTSIPKFWQVCRWKKCVLQFLPSFYQDLPVIPLPNDIYHYLLLLLLLLPSSLALVVAVLLTIILTINTENLTGITKHQNHEGSSREGGPKRKTSIKYITYK